MRRKASFRIKHLCRRLGGGVLWIVESGLLDIYLLSLLIYLFILNFVVIKFCWHFLKNT